MAEGKGITGFLSKDTAGLPNWAWLVVLGAGLAAAYIVPKFFGNSSSSPTPSGTSSTDTSGLGLAVDPTTGLPYAVEGLVPSGGTAGNYGQPGPAGPQGPQGPAGPPGGTVTGTTGVECPGAVRDCPPGTTPTYTTGANGCPAMTCMPLNTTVSNNVATQPLSTQPLVRMTSPAWPGQTSQVRRVA